MERGKELSVFSNIDIFEGAQRMAKALCESTLIPQDYRRNLPNCLIALEISNRVKVSPFMVMQNLHIVKGKPGWSAQYVIGALNSLGRFEPLQFEMSGNQDDDSWGCRAYTTVKATKKRIEGAKVTIEMAKKEKWYQKDGSKWQTMPEVMLIYRSASFFGKVYAPEILIGFSTADELIDITPEKEEKPIDLKKTLMEVKEPEPILCEKKESENVSLTEKQKQIMEIPEDLRMESMQQLKFTDILFKDLSDENCDAIIKGAEFLADGGEK